MYRLERREVHCVSHIGSNGKNIYINLFLAFIIIIGLIYKDLSSSHYALIDIAYQFGLSN